MFLAHEQIAHQDVKRQVGGRVCKRAVCLLHGGAQLTSPRQLMDMVDHFEHSARLRLHEHVCQRQGHIALVRALQFLARLAQMIAPVLAHQHIVDIVAQAIQDPFFFDGCLRFDERLVHLTDLIRLFGWRHLPVGDLQRFKVFDGGGTEASHFLVDLPHQQPRPETELGMLDGVLQISQSRFVPVDLRAE